MNFRRLIVASITALGCLGCNGANVEPPLGVMSDRKLGFGVTEGSVGYEMAFASAKHAGIQFIELPQQWDEIESAAGIYQSEFVTMADEVYPALDTSIVLSLNPIDTNSLRIPTYLRADRWDSPQRIDAYCRWVDWTLRQLPHATVLAISIGNEVDGWFGGHADELPAYTIFCDAVVKHIHATHPTIPVGVKMTYAGRTGKQRMSYDQLENSSDVVMLTYYPLETDFRVRPPATVSNDFDQMITIADGKPVYLLEAGYPSGKPCGSSLAQQADFVDHLFSAWDQHWTEIPLINFVWTCDLSAAEVKAMTQYYDVDLPAFESYLATLGLQTNEGKPKPAWTRLRKNVAERVRQSSGQ